MTQEAPIDLNGSSVLVTGGTGSFGQAFVRHLFEAYKPRRVVVYSRDELKQFEMQQRFWPKELRYFIGDVRDVDRLRRALSGIDVVVHAAALKQVPAAEYNPIECIKTNVMGAENVINACIDVGVRRVVALSTDKAVNPLNLYGATKLCSDKLFIAANHLSANTPTRFSIVRYGNVIGSRGSVIPFFKSRRSSGVLPITDPRMTRFWLTVEEGVRYVDRAIRVMRGGEIFVPKIPSMRVTELASVIGPECRQEVVGIRPGEKLHETLVPRDEAPHTVEFNDFYVIRSAVRLWDTSNDLVLGGEIGRRVKDDFEYRSDNNDDWASGERLEALAG
ncbi:MAG TPA: UDP-N-acetylglucosamine 4,6-dehydratase (inverting) [Candidatus Sulfotelmatobacter sp.]|nr:UDP-N-acetylglucosamine 4,6-dehydratase (inverting) [Candidatus Sulfotelmatobacter sp.]